MPKSIKEELTPEALASALTQWAERATDEWLKPRPSSSPEHPSRKGFTREELVELAKITWLGDDGLRKETKCEPSEAGNVVVPGAGMLTVIASLYKEFGYTLGFMHHVRECMAEDDGYYRNKGTGIRERIDIRGKRQVTARMFLKLKRNPFVAVGFSEWCTKQSIAPSNPAFANYLEASGRFTVRSGAPKESTRLRKAMGGKTR